MAGISGLNGNLIGGSHRLGSWDLTPDKLQTKEVGGAAVDLLGFSGTGCWIQVQMLRKKVAYDKDKRRATTKQTTNCSNCARGEMAKNVKMADVSCGRTMHSSFVPF